MTSKITSQAQILARIKEMSFPEKCQCFLDHKTCKYLEKHGHIIQTQRNVRNHKKVLGLPETLGYPKIWIRFFLDWSLKIWNEWLSPKSYQVWVESRFFSKTAHLCDWSKK